jgi:hypothetical protein
MTCIWSLYHILKPRNASIYVCLANFFSLFVHTGKEWKKISDLNKYYVIYAFSPERPSVTK